MQAGPLYVAFNLLYVEQQTKANGLLAWYNYNFLQVIYISKYRCTVFLHTTCTEPALYVLY